MRLIFTISTNKGMLPDYTMMNVKFNKKEYLSRQILSQVPMDYPHSGRRQNLFKDYFHEKRKENKKRMTESVKPCRVVEVQKLRSSAGKRLCGV